MGFRAEEKYVELLSEQHKLALNVKKQKKLVHAEYVKDHKKIIYLLDVLIILSLLFNIGAMMITNALVIRVAPDKEFVELNPVQCQLQGFKCTEDFSKLYGFMFHAFALGILLAVYLGYRCRVSDDKELLMIILFTSLIFVSCTLDFTNDVGYWFGKIIFGV